MGHHIPEEQKSQLCCSKNLKLADVKIQKLLMNKERCLVYFKAFFWTLLASIEKNNETFKIADPSVEVCTGFLPNKNQFIVGIYFNSLS
jgi:hypothetical protein